MTGLAEVPDADALAALDRGCWRAPSLGLLGLGLRGVLTLGLLGLGLLGLRGVLTLGLLGLGLLEPRGVLTWDGTLDLGLDAAASDQVCEALELPDTCGVSMSELPVGPALAWRNRRFTLTVLSTFWSRGLVLRQHSFLDRTTRLRTAKASQSLLPRISVMGKGHAL